MRAAGLVGFTEAPVIRLEDLIDEQARLFAIADNKLLGDSGWDENALGIGRAGNLQHANREVAALALDERDVVP